MNLEDSKRYIRNWPSWVSLLLWQCTDQKTNLREKRKFKGLFHFIIPRSYRVYHLRKWKSEARGAQGKNLGPGTEAETTEKCSLACPPPPSYPTCFLKAPRTTCPLHHLQLARFPTSIIHQESVPTNTPVDQFDRDNSSTEVVPSLCQADRT